MVYLKLRQAGDYINIFWYYFLFSEAWPPGVCTCLFTAPSVEETILCLENTTPQSTLPDHSYRLLKSSGQKVAAMARLSVLAKFSAKHCRKSSLLAHRWKTKVFYKNKQAGCCVLGPWLTLPGKVSAPIWLLNVILWWAISEIYTSSQVWFGHSLGKKWHFCLIRCDSQQGVYLILLVLCSCYSSCEAEFFRAELE